MAIDCESVARKRAARELYALAADLLELAGGEDNLLVGDGLQRAAELAMSRGREVAPAFHLADTAEP